MKLIRRMKDGPPERAVQCVEGNTPTHLQRTTTNEGNIMITFNLTEAFARRAAR